MGDVRDTIWLFFEEGNGWVWERRSMYGDLIERSDRSWSDEQQARAAAHREAALGGRVHRERWPGLAS